MQLLTDKVTEHLQKSQTVTEGFSHCLNHETIKCSIKWPLLLCSHLSLKRIMEIVHLQINKKSVRLQNEETSNKLQ